MTLHDFTGPITDKLRSIDDQWEEEKLARASSVTQKTHLAYHAIRMALYFNRFISEGVNVELHELLRATADEFNQHSALQRMTIAAFMQKFSKEFNIPL
mgnify:CR=1 FL=1